MRIAEYCEVSNTTVANWFAGRWMPGREQRLFLADIAAGKVDLASRKTGPRRNGAIVAE